MPIEHVNDGQQSREQGYRHPEEDVHPALRGHLLPPELCLLLFLLYVEHDGALVVEPLHVDERERVHQLVGALQAVHRLCVLSQHPTVACHQPIACHGLRLARCQVGGLQCPLRHGVGESRIALAREYLGILQVGVGQQEGLMQAVGQGYRLTRVALGLACLSHVHLHFRIERIDRCHIVVGIVAVDIERLAQKRLRPLVVAREVVVVGLVIGAHERLLVVVLLMAVVVDAACVGQSSGVGGGMRQGEQVAIDAPLELLIPGFLGVVEAAEEKLLRHKAVVLDHGVVDAHGIGDEGEDGVVLYLFGQVARLTERLERTAALASKKLRQALIEEGVSLGALIAASPCLREHLTGIDGQRVVLAQTPCPFAPLPKVRALPGLRTDADSCHRHDDNKQKEAKHTNICHWMECHSTMVEPHFNPRCKISANLQKSKKSRRKSTNLLLK